jgi:hypothetical protein
LNILDWKSSRSEGSERILLSFNSVYERARYGNGSSGTKHIIRAEPNGGIEFRYEIGAILLTRSRTNDENNRPSTSNTISGRRRGQGVIIGFDIARNYGRNKTPNWS